MPVVDSPRDWSLSILRVGEVEREAGRGMKLEGRNWVRGNARRRVQRMVGVRRVREEVRDMKCMSCKCVDVE